MYRPAIFYYIVTYVLNNNNNKFHLKLLSKYSIILYINDRSYIIRKKMDIKKNKINYINMKYSYQDSMYLVTTYNKMQQHNVK